MPITHSSPPWATHSLFANALYRRRRPIAGEEASIVTPEHYSPNILEKIAGFISRNEPIRLILPAFPFKYESPLKTLGQTGDKQPDMAEIISLKYLKKICDEIQKEYSPGASIAIYSDGGVFADSLRPEYTDQARLGYIKELRSVI